MSQVTLEDPKQEQTLARRRPEPVNERSWSAVDWTIVCAILGCAALLAKVVA